MRQCSQVLGDGVVVILQKYSAILIYVNLINIIYAIFLNYLFLVLVSVVRQQVFALSKILLTICESIKGLSSHYCVKFHRSIGA